MIEFSCVYCGQPVRAGAELARQQIPCPACGPTIRVCPAKPRATVPPSAAQTADIARLRAEHWSRMSDEEIREAVLVPVLSAGERSKLALKRALAPWLPCYDDLTLFTFVFAWVMLLHNAIRRLFEALCVVRKEMNLL